MSDVKNTQKAVKGMKLKPTNSHSVCDGCMRGKMHRLPFPKDTERRAKRPLGRLFLDLGGPLVPSFPNKFTYYLLAVDDHTTMYFGKPLHHKNDAEHQTKMLKKEVEAHHEKIGIIRSDGGSEFLFVTLICVEEGIIREITSPYSPQQNGRVERANRTLFDMMRAMMLSRNIGEHFWWEALRTAIHIHNRISNSRIPPNTTPWELWTGSKPNISYFREFGVPCWSWIPEPGSKLKPRGERGIFMGYASHAKAYRIWLPEKRTFAIRRDVVFDESATACCDKPPSLDLHKKSLEAPLPSLPPTSPINKAQQEESPTSPPPAPSRPKRTIKPSLKARLASNLTSHDAHDDEPRSLKEALASPHANDWLIACEEENASLKAMNVYEEVPPPPPGTKIVGSRYVFRSKRDQNGSVSRRKARMVALGHTQSHGIDYNEVFAPVAKYDTLRFVLCLACFYDWEIDHVDIKTAYLHGFLEEVIYLRPPEFFFGTVIWHLLRALYGLKQAGRQWYFRIHKVYISLGFRRSYVDWSLYYRFQNNKRCIVSMSVDDLTIVANSKDETKRVKEELSSEFLISDLGPVQWLLGVKIERYRDRRKLILSQASYIDSILARHNMSDCNSVLTPMIANQRLCAYEGPAITSEEAADYRTFVGELMYLVAMTRPDLSYCTRELAKFMSKPGPDHLSAAKRIMRYLKGTKTLGISYSAELLEHPLFAAFTDADWASHEGRKSISGYVLFGGGGPISWSSKQQNVVALSTCEAEYMGTTHAAKQCIWTRTVATELELPLYGATHLFCDNQGTVACTQNPHHHASMKHIDIRVHFIRDCVNEGFIKVIHIPGGQMIADVLTKALPAPAHTRWLSTLTTDTRVMGGC
jgi:transposase InsO family protein